jgi:cation transport regulator ChaB
MLSSMPTRTEDIPSTIKRSPKKVQRVYEEALEHAHEEYDSEQRAHRVAWGAVKHVAEKQGDHWELKDEQGPSDPRAARGGAAARRGGKPKQELYEEARRAGIEGRSNMSKEELAEALRRHSERQTRRARS